MGVPEGSFAVAMFIVIALPGFIYSRIRRWLRGEMVADRSVSLTIARGAIFAIALTAAYMLLLGPWLFQGLEMGAPDSFVVLDPRRVGAVVCALYLVIPAIISLLLEFQHIAWSAPRWLEKRLSIEPVPKRMALLRWVRMPSPKYGHESTPSAWDHSFRTPESFWVKVRRADGDWVGGWYTRGSFVTTYPEPRSIYIDQQWEMTKSGGFKKEIPGTGIFLVVNDDDLVILTRTTEERDNNDVE